MQELTHPSAIATTNLEAFWMPFTANRQFKSKPRIMVSAKDMHFTTEDGRQVLDGTAGLWCVNAGHCRPKIIEAIHKQVSTLDYAPAFQMGHPGAFQLAERLVTMLPGDLDHVFFANSGSEAVDSALKIAIAYHRAKGQGTRQRLIGRERGYHGVGFGGISVGGIGPNRKFFGSLLNGVDHLPHTHSLEHNAFSRKQPAWGAHLADELERIVALHDASNIAAVIVEPVAGSTGVLIPPQGYLERLRAICDKHGILLIFDEVITGFGRLGSSFAAEHFGVVPDMITVAKGITNGTVPMGAVFVRKEIYDTFMHGPEQAIELAHGYTYSGHPLACAAALATLDVYEEEGLFQHARDLSDYWEDAVHSLRDLPHVIDVRNMGLVAGIELESIPGKPTARAFDCFLRAYEKGLLIRTTGDIIALSPPLIIQKHHIDQIVEMLSDILRETA
ncbi:aspartate aminotransferase family protein [Leptolyngbya sp. FACHB-671]|uniref:aspartate aminotransferase family protein n=1 Tax=unclassified Leptolyngbya TaxID=2650499 RepID=UPI001681EE73|nr:MULTISPECIES: aspartate aminotransferase family protein [unclassified Leptolyngbya]MBD2000135.1 aspartate aminotransferase family protein [Leptolyngbya sp. FACHB-541]MBD2068852.1 aspartate aminotransferase family protein [Leptolyngbya sp. FACHB-671]